MWQVEKGKRLQGQRINSPQEYKTCLHRFGPLQWSTKADFVSLRRIEKAVSNTHGPISALPLRTQIMEPETNPAQSSEAAQETTQRPSTINRDESKRVHRAATRLLTEVEQLPDGDLISQMIVTSLRLLRDETNRADLKLLNRSLREMRYALKVFAPYHATRKVSIFGSARTPEDDPDYTQAVDFAHRMVESGWMAITGAGGGIMAAGHGGAGAEPSFGLAIRLPFEERTNLYITGDPKLIHFRYFFTRKVMFVRGSHAIALFPGGFGTLDEGTEVLTLAQTGRATPMPIVMLEKPGGDYWSSWQEWVGKQLLGRGLIGPHDQRLYKITDNVDEAVEEILHFYSNFHSVRYTRDELIIRVQRRPTPEQLVTLEENFADIKLRGEFRASDALPIEQDEPDLAHLPRLVFAFNRRDYARLRMLIDQLNGFAEETSPM